MDSDNFVTDETLTNLEKLCEESASCFEEIKSNEIDLNEINNTDNNQRLRHKSNNEDKEDIYLEEKESSNENFHLLNNENEFTKQKTDSFREEIESVKDNVESPKDIIESEEFTNDKSESFTNTNISFNYKNELDKKENESLNNENKSLTDEIESLNLENHLTKNDIEPLDHEKNINKDVESLNHEKENNEIEFIGHENESPKDDSSNKSFNDLIPMMIPHQHLSTLQDLGVTNENQLEKTDADKDDTDVDEIQAIIDGGIKNENTETEVANNSETKRSKNLPKKQNDTGKISNKSTGAKSNKQQECVVCKKIVKCKYNIVRNGDTKHLCNDECFATFRAKPSSFLHSATQRNNKDSLMGNNSKQISTGRSNVSTLPDKQKIYKNANSNDTGACDNCFKMAPAQYHLTRTDASICNFCSYTCYISYQNKYRAEFPSQQITQISHQAQSSSKSPYGTRQSSKAKHIVNASNSYQDFPTPSKSIPPVIIQSSTPRQVRNKALLCKPYMQTKATSCRPHVISRPSQTEENWEPQKLALPCPVPMMVPAPMAMYSTPTPYPILIPIPIPVPCFIPTTRKSASGIMKRIKEMQDRMPSDPFEAELLMMAEAVASAGRESESEYEASEEDEVGVVNGEGSSGDVAEDMLQMALRMADMPSDEPILDLEDSVAPAPVRAKEVQPIVQDYAAIGPVMEMLQGIPIKKQTTKRRSNNCNAQRSNTNQRGGLASKRSRLDNNQAVLMQTQAIQQPAVPEPPADTNFVLKFTYGVNAYKHWVVQKNAQIESQIVANQQRGTSVRGLKPFKLDVLQSTADELNYALCLFVREVRKPNGEEYAPDSILYLCLGIQEYLYENGRIDNIFTDFFYERFTEYLNEVLSRYEVRLNAQGMLVCRIEEEHLWEAKQLGAHSPYVLLNTLVYFNTKHFMLRTPCEHLALSFSHIMKHWKKTNCPSGKPGRSVYLRYYSPGQGMDPKRKKEEVPVYEQAENADNPLRCPVKLYEFYLSKCPESIKNRNDVFYLVPERSCVPDSPVWYSTQSMSIDGMTRMLNRLRVVREIQEAHLSAMAPYYT